MSKTVIITSYIEFSLNLGEYIDSDDFISTKDSKALKIIILNE